MSKLTHIDEAGRARMVDVSDKASTAREAVAEAHRREWAYVLAATVRVTRDIDAAEEAVQDAYVQALRTWGAEGVPSRPGAWLTTVARRNALNTVRRSRTLAAKLPLLLVTAEEAEAPAGGCCGWRSRTARPGTPRRSRRRTGWW